MKPVLIHTRHFPSRGYHAITLFPFVLYNGRELTESEIRHETVHLYQQLSLLVIPFYLLYLLFWIVGMIRYRDSNMAYRNIPFERSAYLLETRPTVSPLHQAFHWFRCLG